MNRSFNSLPRRSQRYTTAARGPGRRAGDPGPVRPGLFQGAPADPNFALVNAFTESDLNGGHVTTEWVWTSTDFIWKTGKKFSVRGITAIDREGGKIARNSDYWDGATVFRQIGLLPKGF